MEIAEIIHLYIGQEMMSDDGTKWKLNVVDLRDIDSWLSETKPILRRLTSMTEEEKEEFKKLIPWIDFVEFKGNTFLHYEHEEVGKHETRAVCLTTQKIRTLPWCCIPWLLSKGFWLFDERAFEEGKILEKTN